MRKNSIEARVNRISPPTDKGNWRHFSITATREARRAIATRLVRQRAATKPTTAELKKRRPNCKLEYLTASELGQRCRDILKIRTMNTFHKVDISRWESGKRMPSLPHLEVLARAYGIRLHELLGVGMKDKIIVVNVK